MGYLDNSIITVDAILTKKGRENLAKGDGSFNIVYFALADDEIDYSLYNVNHPSGSAYYGEAIENMPMLEAFIDGNQDVKYKLITLAKGTDVVPTITNVNSSYTFQQGGEENTITPKTMNYLPGTVSEPKGYIATVDDSRIVNIATPSPTTTVATTLSDKRATPTSKTVVGTSFILTALRPGSTTLRISGVNSGQSIASTIIVSATAISASAYSTR
jgi:hypothetical protein